MLDLEERLETTKEFFVGMNSKLKSLLGLTCAGFSLYAQAEILPPVTYSNFASDPTNNIVSFNAEVIPNKPYIVAYQSTNLDLNISWNDAIGHAYFSSETNVNVTLGTTFDDAFFFCMIPLNIPTNMNFNLDELSTITGKTLITGSVSTDVTPLTQELYIGDYWWSYYDRFDKATDTNSVWGVVDTQNYFNDLQFIDHAIKLPGTSLVQGWESFWYYNYLTLYSSNNVVSLDVPTAINEDNITPSFSFVSEPGKSFLVRLDEVHGTNNTATPLGFTHLTSEFTLTNSGYASVTWDRSILTNNFNDTTHYTLSVFEVPTNSTWNLPLNWPTNLPDLSKYFGPVHNPRYGAFMMASEKFYPVGLGGPLFQGAYINTMQDMAKLSGYVSGLYINDDSGIYGVDQGAHPVSPMSIDSAADVNQLKFHMTRTNQIPARRVTEGWIFGHANSEAFFGGESSHVTGNGLNVTTMAEITSTTLSDDGYPVSSLYGLNVLIADGCSSAANPLELIHAAGISEYDDRNRPASYAKGFWWYSTALFQWQQSDFNWRILRDWCGPSQPEMGDAYNANKRWHGLMHYQNRQVGCKHIVYGLRSGGSTDFHEGSSPPVVINPPVLRPAQ